MISAQNHQRLTTFRRTAGERDPLGRVGFLFDERVEERVSVSVCVFISALMQANLPATLSCHPCRAAQSTSHSRPAPPFTLCLINDRTLVQSTSEFHILKP